MNQNGTATNKKCVIQERLLLNNDENSMDKYIIEEVVEYTEDKRSRKRHSEGVSQTFQCAVCTKIYQKKSYLVNHVKRSNHCIGIGIPRELDAVLPKAFPYYVVYYKESSNNYEIKLCFPIMLSREEVNKWVHQYMGITDQQYVTRTVKTTPKGSIVFEQWYNCHRYHSVVKRKVRTKGSECKSNIFASVSKFGYSNINIKFIHNHPVSEYAQRHGQPNDTVKFVYRNLFDNGLGPTAALQSYKNHVYLQSPDKETYLQNISNRAKCPDIHWVYYDFKRHNSGFMENAQIKNNIQIFISNYNYHQQQEICAFKELKNDNFVISIMTPFMTRVCEMNTTGELILIDSTGIVDRFGLYVFPILTLSTAGRLPVGLVLTTKRKELVIKEGFNLFTNMLNERSFGGRGKAGPSIVMTDAGGTEINALKTIFPQAKMLLCVFHVLQTVFRWILKANEISESREKWQALYSDVKCMVYSTNKKEIDEVYERLQRNLNNFPSLLRYIIRLYEGRERWAISYQIGNETVRYIKDNICHQIKATTPSQYMEFLVKSYEQPYVNKIMDIVMGRIFSDAVVSEPSIEKYEMMPYADDTVTVYNREKNLYYVIYSDIGYCTCYTGVTGRYCKHQRMWSVKTKAFSTHAIEYAHTLEQKAELWYAATGCLEVPNHFEECEEESTRKDCENTHSMSTTVGQTNGTPKKDKEISNFCLQSVAEDISDTDAEDLRTILEDESLVDESELSAEDDEIPVEKEKLLVVNSTPIEQIQKEFVSAVDALRDVINDDVLFYEAAMDSMSKQIEKLTFLSQKDLNNALENFSKYETAVLNK